jgi:hypothetical protein
MLKTHEGIDSSYSDIDFWMRRSSYEGMWICEVPAEEAG